MRFASSSRRFRPSPSASAWSRGSQRRDGARRARRRGTRDRRARAAAEGARAARHARKSSIRRSRCRCWCVPAMASIATRAIAFLVADGVDGEPLARLHAGTCAARRRAAIRRAPRSAASTAPVVIPLEVEISIDAGSIGGLRRGGASRRRGSAVKELAQLGHAMEFVKDQYRHCKPILASVRRALCSRPRESRRRCPRGRRTRACSVARMETRPRPSEPFADAIAKHRHFERETLPPRV